MKAFNWTHKTLIGGLLLIQGIASYAQSQDEQLIRNLIKQENAGKMRIPITHNYILANGLFPRPVIGVARAGKNAVGDASMPAPRRVMTVLRLTVSQAGDIANEFGTYSFSAEAASKNPQRMGSYLRTWKKVEGKWKVDILFTATTAERLK